jgi:hypothetical protein
VCATAARLADLDTVVATQDLVHGVDAGHRIEFVAEHALDLACSELRLLVQLEDAINDRLRGGMRA